MKKVDVDVDVDGDVDVGVDVGVRVDAGVSFTGARERRRSLTKSKRDKSRHPPQPELTFSRTSRMFAGPKPWAEALETKFGAPPWAQF